MTTRDGSDVTAERCDMMIDGIHPSPHVYARTAQQIVGYIQAFAKENGTPFRIGVVAWSALHANILLALKSMHRRAYDSSGNGIHIPAQVLNPMWITRVHHP